MSNAFVNKKVDLTSTSATTLYTVPTATTAVLKSILVSEDSGNADTITITFEDEVTFKFAVEGDWLWLQLEDDECGPFAPEAINEDDWDGRVSAQTTPSMCE